MKKLERIAYRTHIGLVRKNNQDSVLALAQRGLLIVADGMGGQRGGEVASQAAVQYLNDTLDGIAPDEQELRRAVENANTVLYIMQLKDARIAGMGTTLTAMWVNGDTAHLAQVGDSRAYRLRGTVLQQLTRDHSVVYDMVDAGIITREEARQHPYRNIITRALGTSDDIEVDMFLLSLQEGDRYLLCSDGLCGVLEDVRIAELMMKPSLEEAADALLQETLDNGAPDNVTMILAEVTA